MEYINLSSKDLLSLTYAASMTGWESKFYFLDAETLLKIYKSNIWIELVYAKKDAIIALNEEPFVSNPALIIPKQGVILDGSFRGHTIPYIAYGVSLKQILQNKEEPLDFKLSLLKEVLQIIAFFDRPNSQVILNDIHEGNFIWDIRDKRVKALDLDSAYCRGGFVQPTLNINDNITSFLSLEGKYGIENLMVTPNHNSMYACFIYMLINTLIGTRIKGLTPDKLESILMHLEKCGLSKEVIQAISLIYTPKENYFTEELLNLIDPHKNYTLTRK